jgi:Flp pilus assembly protein CpaB
VSEFAERISSSRLFSTRGGTIAVGVFAALLALLVLLLYLSHYRTSIRNSSAPVPVLVSNHLIPQGTSGDVLGTGGGFEATEVAKDAVKAGAITDPALLKGKVAIADIYPGQQLTVTDFSPTAVATLGSRLKGKQRAMTVPVDSTRGMLGSVIAGDRVDVIANLSGVEKAVLQNVYVLGVSGGTASSGLNSGTGSSYEITLRVSTASAARLAFASDNGDVWIILRPPTNGGQIAGNSTSLQKVLSGTHVPEGD